MAEEGPNSPGTMADDDTVGTEAWNYPPWAKVNDETYVTVNLNVQTSHYLKATNFGFSIPVGATIDGILVEIKQLDTYGTVIENSIKIVKSDGTIGTTDKSTGSFLPTTGTYISYGSSSDLWGETWTATDINDVDFGVVYSATNPNANGRSPGVDHIRITVYYTVAGGDSKGIMVKAKSS